MNTDQHNRAKAAALTQEWGNLLSTDPQKLLDYYHPHGILIPTLSDNIYYGTAQISQYFSEFLKTLGADRKVIFKSISGQWDAGGHWIMTSGQYLFIYLSEGNVQEVHARFSFLFTYATESGWKIANHHSSLDPD